MRQKIVRTMTTTTISACKTDMVNGSPVVTNLDPVSALGNLNYEKAMKALRKIHGKTTALTIIKLETATAKYEISVDDFFKHATKIEEPETTK